MAVDTQYAYAVGRIRAVERKLIDKAKFERMIEAKSLDEALKVLVDADYGDAASEIAGAWEYEKLLKEENKKLYQLLEEINPHRGLFDVFLYRNDYHNARVILKSEFIGKEHEDILVDSGSIPTSKLKVMIRERKMTDMPVRMRKAVEECIDIFNRTTDPQSIDLIMDRACFSQMMDTAVSSKNAYLKGLVENMVDIANIGIFLRVRSLKKTWDFLLKALLTGGSIHSDVFVKGLQDSLEGFINTMRYTPYSAIVEEGVASYQSTGSLTLLEKLADDSLMAYAKKSRFKFLSIEPLIGYLIGKESEIKNVRIVMVGKINQIASDTIRERLRDTYV